MGLGPGQGLPQLGLNRPAAPPGDGRARCRVCVGCPNEEAYSLSRLSLGSSLQPINYARAARGAVERDLGVTYATPLLWYAIFGGERPRGGEQAGAAGWAEYTRTVSRLSPPRAWWCRLT